MSVKVEPVWPELVIAASVIAFIVAAYWFGT